MRQRATGIAQSVQARLKIRAEELGQPYEELLIRFGTERLLYRLSRSEHRDDYILKGALLIQHWFGHAARPTRDIDLLGPDGLSQDDVRMVLAAVLGIAVEDDGLEFDLASVSVAPIRVGSPTLGWRAKFDGYLGRSRIRFQLDIGLGDVVEPGPVDLEPRPLLDLPVAALKAYTPYNVVAEKLEAMVNLGGANSRMKDYFDLFQLSSERSFEGLVLSDTIRRTFARRGTPIPDGLPEGLSSDFAMRSDKVSQWQAFLRRGRLQHWKYSLEETCAAVWVFSDLVFAAAGQGKELDSYWPPRGPWQEQATE